MFLHKLAAIVLVTGALAIAVPQMAPSLIASFSPGPGFPEGGEAAPAPERPPAASEPLPAERPAPRYRQVVLTADGRGHFVAEAVVNGRRIEAMIDTGATAVALTEKTAERLGIHLAPSAFRQPLSTGNGVVAAAPITLDEIRLGDITVRRVGAVVVPGDALPVNLLGMTYLRRLARFEAAGGQLLLEQ